MDRYDREDMDVAQGRKDPLTGKPLRAPLHCWMGYLEWCEEHGFEWDGSQRTCMLPAGHDCPHEWTDDGEIVVEFKRSGDGE